MRFELCMDALCQAAVEDSPREPDVRRVPAEILRQLKTDPRGASLPDSLDEALEALLELWIETNPSDPCTVCGGEGCFWLKPECTCGAVEGCDHCEGSGREPRKGGALQHLSDHRATRKTVPEDLGERVWDADALEFGRKP